jgi:hypothetical protein
MAEATPSHIIAATDKIHLSFLCGTEWLHAPSQHPRHRNGITNMWIAKKACELETVDPISSFPQRKWQFKKGVEDFEKRKEM